MTRALIVLGLSAVKALSDRVAVLPQGELDLRVHATTTASPPGANALAEVRVAETRTNAETALSKGKVESVSFQPDAEALPMACSESLIKTSSISSSSCKEEHGVCVHGPLQSLMDGNWEYYVSVDEESNGASWSILDGYAAAPDAKMNALNPPIETLAIRLRPTSWKRSIAFRASMRGCNADTVKTGEMKLNTEFRALFPAQFKDLAELSTELRLQVSEYTGGGMDQVQIQYIKKASPPDDKTVTLAGVEFLPKPGTGPTGDANNLLNSLATGLGDTSSTIYQFTSDIVNKAARANIDTFSCSPGGTPKDCHE